MRARTWLVVGAVALIGLVAVADAVRGRLQSDAGTSVTAADEDAIAPPGLTGVLYYSDEHCQLRAVRLPAGTRVEAPAWSGCRFVLSPDGLSAAPEGSRFAPRGRLRVASSGELLQVFSRNRPVTGPFLAGAPAFKPDGTLTFFRGGRVVAWQGERVLLDQRRLREIIRRALGAPRPRGVVVRELAWLSDVRAVAVLGWGPQEVLAMVERGEALPAFPAHGGGFGRLWTSPHGDYFALESRVGVLLFDHDGRQLGFPRLANFHDLAWSPDEHWLAIAAGGRVHILSTVDDRPPVRLPIDARGLAWR